MYRTARNKARKQRKTRRRSMAKSKTRIRTAVALRRERERTKKSRKREIKKEQDEDERGRGREKGKSAKRTWKRGMFCDQLAAYYIRSYSSGRLRTARGHHPPPAHQDLHCARMPAASKRWRLQDEGCGERYCIIFPLSAALIFFATILTSFPLCSFLFSHFPFIPWQIFI